mgnify:FL=1|jgi:4'-phosphopantetheinyl transferase
MQSMTFKNSEIHLWHIDHADFDLPQLQSECLAWLTKTELARYQRFQLDRHRKQLLLGQMLIRSVLSLYDQSIDRPAWRLIQNEYGKPAIHPDQQTLPLFFNLTHSGEKLVLAVAGFECIGVDIEQCSKQRRLGRLAARYFSARETAELQATAEQDQLRRFYELWTLKEAYIKACGLGLAIPLHHFSYSFPTDAKLAISFDSARADDPELWQIWQLGAGDQFKLALAAKAGEGNPIQNIGSWQMTGLEEFHARDSTIIRTN